MESGHDASEAETDDLRTYLAACNGIVGLEIVDPTDIDQAVRIFRRDGFVVVRDVLGVEQLEFLRRGVFETIDEIVALDVERHGNRGAFRYSFGGSSLTRSMLHRSEWQMLVDLPLLTPIITAIFESADYRVRAAGGDFCLPGATGYQPLHSDMGDWLDDDRTPYSAFHDPRGALTTRDLPSPYVCTNFLLFDQTPLNGPTRQIPGTHHSRAAIPSLDDEPEWMRLSTVCPAPAGAVQIRDVRAWHGGTPNLSDSVRAIPNVEFYAPWFHEPTLPGIEYSDWQQLSDHGRRITRHHVLDSSQQLRAGFKVEPFRRRRSVSRCV